MRSNQILVQETPEDKIAEWIDVVKQSSGSSETLLELLPEQALVYKGRSTNEIIRIRGYILAAFETLGLPDTAIPYVLEELESGRDAYLVAAAAKAVRGISKPTEQLIPFLFKSVENIKYMDDALTFDSYKPQWPIVNYTTALTEIFETFKHLGKIAHSALPKLEVMYEDDQSFSEKTRAKIQESINYIHASGKEIGKNCCSGQVNHSLLVRYSHNQSSNSDLLNEIEFEDQDTKSINYRDFFAGVPSIVVFFYSRCNNPNKCSLTITKLAKLQQAIKNQGLEKHLKTAAITYDPEYDLSPRLKVYGENRGVVFSCYNRIFRTRKGFKELQDFFQLGVNFNNSIVNRHRIELFVLDDQGEISTTFARLQWDISEVLDAGKSLLKNSSLRSPVSELRLHPKPHSID